MNNHPAALLSVMPRGDRGLATAGFDRFPALIVRAGEKATFRFLEFFTAKIRNKNTRVAYGRAVGQFFAWCDERGLELQQLNPLWIAVYIEQHPAAAPTIKQHLAALRMLFDWLVIGQILPVNPAMSVRGPKHVVKKGRTPVLAADEARQLLDAIETDTLLGLRDRALIALMTYTFGRVGAVIHMRVEDYYIQGRKSWVQLREKGSKLHHVPCHHRLDEYLHAYIERAGIEQDQEGFLFRSAFSKSGTVLTEQPLHQQDVHAMIRKRAAAAGIRTAKIGCHTLRATGITAYMKNGGRLEMAQQIANHESPRTTKLYDRSNDEISLDEIERIVI